MSDSYIPSHLRRLVIKRATNCCEYCRALASYSPDSLAVDHILPRSLGGLTIADNLALACLSCNQHKSNRISHTDPMTNLTVALFNPRIQQWREQFAWSDDFTLVSGLTPTGRATAAALHLNRPGLVNLRRVLYAFGIHPPAEA